jgi:hypothetical protein
MTVNQRVSGSSPEGGARYRKGFSILSVEALFSFAHSLHTNHTLARGIGLF